MPTFEFFTLRITVPFTKSTVPSHATLLNSQVTRKRCTSDDKRHVLQKQRIDTTENYYRELLIVIVYKSI